MESLFCRALVAEGGDLGRSIPLPRLGPLRSAPAATTLLALNCLSPFEHEDGECLLEIFAESHAGCFVPSHDDNLSALHVGALEELYYLIRHLGGSVISSLRSCWRFIQNCCPQLKVVTMNNRSCGRIRLVDCSVRERF